MKLMISQKTLIFIDVNIIILRMRSTTATRAFRKDVFLPVAEFQWVNKRVYSLILPQGDPGTATGAAIQQVMEVLNSKRKRKRGKYHHYSGDFERR